jgi:hypothetical protein
MEEMALVGFTLLDTGGAQAGQEVSYSTVLLSSMRKVAHVCDMRDSHMCRSPMLTGMVRPKRLASLYLSTVVSISNLN